MKLTTIKTGQATRRRLPAETTTGYEPSTLWTFPNLTSVTNMWQAVQNSQRKKSSSYWRWGEWDCGHQLIPTCCSQLGNCYIWACKIELVLRAKVLWSIVSGREAKPNDDDTKREKLIFRTEIALNTILLTIDGSCSATVFRTPYPYATCESLPYMFQQVSGARIDSYLVELRSLKISVSENVMDSMNRLITVKNKLAAADHAI